MNIINLSQQIVHLANFQTTAGITAGVIIAVKVIRKIYQEWALYRHKNVLDIPNEVLQFLTVLFSTLFVGLSVIATGNYSTIALQAAIASIGSIVIYSNGAYTLTKELLKTALPPYGNTTTSKAQVSTDTTTLTAN